MKFLSTLLLPLALLTLTACGGSSGGGDDKDNNDGSITLAPTIAPTATPSVAPSVIPSITPTVAPSEAPSTTERYLLEWQTPNTRIDGSELLASEIAGYTLRWTNNQTQAQGEINIGSDENQWQIELPKGDYQFELASKDSNGRISQFVIAQ
ncbi:hypothetical protein [Motilimonas eburnea]|uniref:hypothetical protein n=1 Tax=Motilimonas eburnea TaxID=1737488 RepID=UPI001E428FE4|nr:hypothetical protein [Motilimonas eburnea]MCE2572708.1 hypothetical protein [Motilimonas eburnea]